MGENLMADGGWVPEACTLPTVEQPLRRAGFDAMFAQDLIGHCCIKGRPRVGNARK